MVAIERQIQKIRPGKWADLQELDKKFTALENRHGWPAKKRYQCLLGGHDTDTLIIERQWDSLAAMETVYEKAMADPEFHALFAETAPIIESQQIEIYTPLS